MGWGSYSASWGSSMEKYIINPKTKRGEATLEKILEAARCVFYEKGFHKGGIADIAKKAGVGHGTFYVYFDSKISVYRYLLVEYGKRIRAKSSEAIAGCTNRKEAERVGIRSFFEFVLEDQGIFSIIWESLYIDKALFDEFYTTFSESYVHRLQQAQLDGEVRDIDPKVLSYVLMGITNFVALNSLVLKQENNIDHLVDEIMKVLENGMFTK